MSRVLSNKNLECKTINKNEKTSSLEGVPVVRSRFKKEFCNTSSKISSDQDADNIQIQNLKDSNCSNLKSHSIPKCVSNLSPSDEDNSIKNRSCIINAKQSLIKQKEELESKNSKNFKERDQEIPDKITGRYSNDFNILSAHETLLKRFELLRLQKAPLLLSQINIVKQQLTQPQTLINRRETFSRLQELNKEYEHCTTDVYQKEYLVNSSALLDIYRTIRRFNRMKNHRFENISSINDTENKKESHLSNSNSLSDTLSFNHEQTVGSKDLLNSKSLESTLICDKTGSESKSFDFVPKSDFFCKSETNLKRILSQNETLDNNDSDIVGMYDLETNPNVKNYEGQNGTLDRNESDRCENVISISNDSLNQRSSNGMDELDEDFSLDDSFINFIIDSFNEKNINSLSPKIGINSNLKDSKALLRSLQDNTINGSTLRHLIIQKYLDIASKYINVEVIRELPPKVLCPGCGIDFRDLHIDDNDVQVCPKCRIEQIAPPRSSVLVENSNTNYEDRETFIKSLRRYEGKQINKLPDNIIPLLDDHFKSYGLADSKTIRALPLTRKGTKLNTSRDLMHKALKSTGLVDYYEDMNLICHLCWGWALPDISSIESTILDDYDKIQQIFKELPKERTSNLNGQFRLFKHLEMRGHTCSVHDFKVVTTRDIIEEYDSLWEKMIREAQKRYPDAGFVFYDTI